MPDRFSFLRILRVTVVVGAALCLPDVAGAQRAVSNPVELANLGWAAVEEARYGDALDAFTAASEQLPDEASVWLGRGFSAYMLGRDKDAEASLELSISLEPRLTYASRFLGELYFRTGRSDDAIETYEAALKYAPGDPNLKSKLADWQQQSQLHDRFRQSSVTHFRVLFEGGSDEALARRIVEMLETAYRNVGGVLASCWVFVVLCGRLTIIPLEEP